MPVIMNEFPDMLDRMDPEQAQAAAAQWMTDNKSFIDNAIKKHKSWLIQAEVDKFQLAYDGAMLEIDELERDRGDEVNHKLYVNYSQVIIDTVVDYLLGTSPTWAVEADQDEDAPPKELLEAYRKDIVRLLRDDNTLRVLSEQLRQGSIAGYSGVLAWVDEYGAIDFDEFAVQELFPVYDTAGRMRLLIRYYDELPDDELVGDTNIHIDFYDGRYHYQATADSSLETIGYEEGSLIEHRAGRVPGSIFINAQGARYTNRKYKAGVSDLGNGVYSLLVAAASMMSDRMNHVDRLLDQFLLLENVTTNEDEVKMMRKTRALVLKGKDSKASFIAPSQDDNAVTNLRKDLVDAIYDMTQTPRVNDIAGATATEIKMKYAPLDIKTNKKSTFFMQAVKQLVAVLTDMLNYKRLTEAGVANPYDVIKNADESSTALYQAHWLVPKFKRNMPQNYQELATIVSTLYDKVPDIYLYELLWFADDPEQVLKDMVAQTKQRQKTAAETAAASLFGSQEFVQTGGKDGDNEDGDDEGAGK